MATLLTPDVTYTINNVPVQVKLIPDGTKWENATAAKAAGFTVGSAYKNGGLIRGTGKPKFITIHNTADLSNVNDDAEQYTRATFNEAMGSTRVHFYVDDIGAWQNLRAGTGMFPADPINRAEIGWHSGDGVTTVSGNYNSVAIECIMGDTAAHDEKAKDNAARLIAWLLQKYRLTIDALVSHTYWVAQVAGKKKANVDEQCTTLIRNKKWCPVYIFGSTNEAVALKNWKAFKDLVKSYMNGTETPKVQSKTISVQVIDKPLNIRTGPAITYPVIGKINDNYKYTVVEEQNGWGLLKAYQSKRNGWINLGYTKTV